MIEIPASISCSHSHDGLHRKGIKFSFTNYVLFLIPPIDGLLWHSDYSLNTYGGWSPLNRNSVLAYLVVPLSAESYSTTPWPPDTASTSTLAGSRSRYEHLDWSRCSFEIPFGQWNTSLSNKCYLWRVLWLISSPRAHFMAYSLSWSVALFELDFIIFDYFYKWKLVI